MITPASTDPPLIGKSVFSQYGKYISRTSNAGNQKHLRRRKMKKSRRPR